MTSLIHLSDDKTNRHVGFFKFSLWIDCPNFYDNSKLYIFMTFILSDRIKEKNYVTLGKNKDLSSLPCEILDYL